MADHAIAAGGEVRTGVSLREILVDPTTGEVTGLALAGGKAVSCHSYSTNEWRGAVFFHLSLWVSSIRTRIYG